MKFSKWIATIVMIGLIFSISACGGDGVITEGTQVGLILPAESYKTFETEHFAMQYPRDWDVKNNAQVANQFKETVQAVLISNFKDPFFTPVITIEALKNAEGLGNPEFAEAFIKKNESGLISYVEIERKSIPLNVGDAAINSYLIRFKGKEKLSDDVLEFLQVYLAGGEWGYVITGAFDPNSEGLEIDKMVQALQTVRMK